MTVTRRDKSSISPTAGGGRDIPASPSAWQRLIGEDGLQKWAFYVPIAFMVLFFAIPMTATVVWSVLERTQFWMEPGFTFLAYENFFTSARVENFLNSMKTLNEFQAGVEGSRSFDSLKDSDQISRSGANRV